jgi:hypothetical protein
MAFYEFLLLLLLQLVAAQSPPSVQPSNDTIPTPAGPLQLTYSSTAGSTFQAVVVPLTAEIGVGATLTGLSVS